MSQARNDRPDVADVMRYGGPVPTGIGGARLANAPKQLYRVMGAAELAKSKNAIQGPVKGSCGDKWLSETPKHAVGGKKKGFMDLPANTNSQLGVVEVNRPAYNKARGDFVKQMKQPKAPMWHQERLVQGFKAHHSKPELKHAERVPGGSKRINVGYKPNQLPEANRMVKSVSAVPRNSVSKYKTVRFLKNNKLAVGSAALGVAMSATDIVFSILEDGEFGRQATVATSALVVEGVGMATLTSALLPMLGAFPAAAFAGVLIAALAVGVQELILCLWPGKVPPAYHESLDPHHFFVYNFDSVKCLYFNAASSLYYQPEGPVRMERAVTEYAKTEYFGKF